jgi:hypothetical protein
MPYEIKPVKGGFKVFKSGGGNRTAFSRSPLSMETAIKQMRALYVHSAPEKGTKK